MPNIHQVGLPGLLDLAREEARRGRPVNTAHLLAAVLRVEPGINPRIGADQAREAAAAAAAAARRPRRMTRQAERVWRKAARRVEAGDTGTVALYRAMTRTRCLARRLVRHG